MIDVVIPSKNELEFLEIAEKLNYSKICFLYAFKEKEIKKRLQKFKKSKIEIFYGSLAKPENLQNINSNLIVVRSSEKNRHVLEKTKTDLLFDLENHRERDFMHSRNSSLNQVMCKIAKKKDMMIGFSFSSILNSNEMLRTQILGRMKQNIRLCRKYKVKMVFASFTSKPYEMRSYHDLISFAVTLGMHPKEAKESIQNVYKRIMLNIRKKESDYITEDIEIVK